MIEATFGSWNEAVTAAGLVPLPQGGLPKSEQRRLERLGKSTTAASSIHSVTDAELLDDLLRLEKNLGYRPSGNQIAAKGQFGLDVYVKRCGSAKAAFDAAKARADGANN